MAAQLAGAVDITLSHSSGRPWLLARTNTGRLVTHNRGNLHIALAGATSATSSDLEQVGKSVRTPGDLAAVSRRIPGSYCVLGSADGIVYAAGPAMETRKIFYASINGVCIAADRADVLAELGGFGIDAATLALRLVRALPYPCGEIPLWRQVESVAGGDYVTIQRDGVSVSRRRWWHRPEQTMSRAEGAEGLRHAIQQAVRSRVIAGEPMACDLSGGLDSTPLCFFAAQEPGGVLARTLYNDDPGGREDLDWALRALKSMPGVHTHITFSTDEMPDFYEGLANVRVRFDEPTRAATAGPRIQQLLTDDGARGIRTHINGLGGDHLLRGLRGWEHTLMRSRPLLAWRRARAEDVPGGVGPLTTLSRLLDRRSYSQWFRDTLHNSINGVQPPRAPRTNDWSAPLGLPPWLTDEARAAVVRKLRDIADRAEPLAADLAGHLDVFTLRDAGRLIRSTGQIGHPLGVAYEAPLVDDHVVEIALAVRREERDSPLEWKPLMKAAMKDLLPDDFLRRTSKVGGAPQSVRGYAAHYDSLMALCEESGLSASGLIDMKRLSEATKPDSKSTPSDHIHETIDAAIFLRNSENLVLSPA
ncbi:asparagine synthase-related protein [Nocardia transvalensis]|uniref:asparagine synthase-related protein n=1 Tax=Nocardia transvalensis TaxID=37333 RepID=UPI0018953E64|nr:asparagine synthase-related protein [Nocardia transvalensis]MBF6332532.1 hypothetical protein [Nocardia transvalensis]